MKFILYIYLVVLVTGCSLQQSTSVEGYLLINDWNSISLYKLGSKETALSLYSRKGNNYLHGLDFAGEDKVIFQETHLVDGTYIMMLDYKNNSINKLCRGDNSIYLQDTDELIYYYYDEQLELYQLVRSRLLDLDTREVLAVMPERITDKSGKMNWYRLFTPINLSNGKILFQGEDLQFWIYDYQTSEKQKFGLGNEYYPLLFRAKTNELLSYKDENESYNKVLINMTTKEEVRIPQLDWGKGCTYIADYDSIIYSRGIIVPKFFYSIRSFSFENKKSRKIMDGNYESILWFKTIDYSNVAVAKVMEVPAI